jgi:hypothetical protein
LNGKQGRDKPSTIPDEPGGLFVAPACSFLADCGGEAPKQHLACAEVVRSDGKSATPVSV